MKSGAILLATLVSIGSLSLIASFPLQSSATQTAQELAGHSQPRSVKGQVLYSTEMPAVNLKFDVRFRYAGSHTFILFDNARAEQHFFVDADKQGRIHRMYWVQFEGYLPTNDYSYEYETKKTVNIGGLDFIADAFATNVETNPGRPGSDRIHARDYLESKGYRWESPDVLLERLVHLIGEPKRNELMIIYAEDMIRIGLTATDLTGDDAAVHRMREVSKGLLERALDGMEVLR